MHATFIENHFLDFVSSAACLMIPQLKVGLIPEWLVWYGLGNSDHPIRAVPEASVHAILLFGERQPLFLPAKWQA